MSAIGSYTNTAFSPSQKFLVLDPSTGSTSLVLGSSLVNYISPTLNYAFTESTREAALTEDYRVGQIIITSGGTSINDGANGTFLVVAGGEGDYPMLNGNDLLLLPFGDLAGSDISQAEVTNGSGTRTGEELADQIDTNTSDIDNRVIRVGSVAEIEALSVDAGNVISLNAGGRSGVFDVVAGDFSTELAADTFNAIYVGLFDDPDGDTKVAKRRGSEIVRHEWFDITDDPSLSTDQTARVREFFRIAAQSAMGIAYNATVGISDKIEPASNLKLLCKDFTLKCRSDFAGDTGFRLAISFDSVSDIRIESLILDGNESTLGGLYPVFGGDYARGIGIQGGCENIVLSQVQSNNVQGNAFIHYSGGSKVQSKNIYFDRCTSANSGLGFGQEIAQDPTGSNLVGPGYTEYRNCVADLCNYGLYIAGGEFNVIGGNYHSKRLQALTVYTGDGHAVTKGSFLSTTFEVTPETGTNTCGYIHCINKQSAAPNYENQQELHVSFEGICKFIQNSSTANLDIEEGANVSVNSSLFSGGTISIRTQNSSLTGGPYRAGVVVFNDAEFTDFATAGMQLVYEVTAKNPRFRSPSTGSGYGVQILAGGKPVLYNPVFGAVDDATTLGSGVFTAISGTSAYISQANPENVSTLFNATSANSELWLVENTVGGNAFDKSLFYGSGSPEGVVAAALGRLYLDYTNGDLYVKETANLGNTGWVNK